MEGQGWRCYFEDIDGTVLVTAEAWDTPEEALAVGRRIISDPEDYELEDPDGIAVPASEHNPDAYFTIENDEDGERFEPADLDNDDPDLDWAENEDY